jgi:hypothetical protein
MANRKRLAAMLQFAVVVLVVSMGFWLVWVYGPKLKPYGHDHPNRVLTAEVLLATLEQETPFWEREFRPTFLPQSELEIVAAELKSRYPVVSIRERLYFQDDHPKPVERKIEWHADARFPSDGFHSQRARALSELHSDKVYQFINRAGQGIMRSPPPEPADLKIWDRYTERIDTERVDSKILGEPLVELTGQWRTLKERSWLENEFRALSSTGLPRKELVANFHRNVQEGFAQADSLGYVQDVDRAVGFESHRIRLPQIWNGNLRSAREVANMDADSPAVWKVNRIHLVSLLMHETPVVYKTESLLNMDELSGVDAPTRKLDDFEFNSLEKLQRGQDVVAQATANRIIMLGAIRANQSCRECHNVRNDDLLGAFSYELIRKPIQDSPLPRF